MSANDVREEPALFRVHFEDGEKLDVTAMSPPEARQVAIRRHEGRVRKIKLIKEDA